MINSDYPRDPISYDKNPPNASWSGGARVTLQFILNYEESDENCVLHDDADSEQFLSEIISAAAYPARHMSMGGIYEYGSHTGMWCTLHEFEKHGLPPMIFDMSVALRCHPNMTQAFVDLGHGIACHGWCQIHYQNIDEATEHEHMCIDVEIIRELTDNAPLGWYTGHGSPNARRLVVEYGGFVHDADYYGDDLPFRTEVEVSSGERKPHLVVSCTLNINDIHLAGPQGFNMVNHFYQYLKDAFDVLYEEGDPNGPTQLKMLSVGMYCCLLGHSACFHTLQRFLDCMQSHDGVWIYRRIDIVQHRIQNHPYAKRPVLNTTA